MKQNYWLNKLSYLSLFFLVFAIYWFPDVILGYPEIYLRALAGYERQVIATWIYLGNIILSLFLGILICYKLGYFKNTLSIFKAKNILFLLFAVISLFVVYFFTYTYYNSHFTAPGIANDQTDYSRQLVFPFVQFISFAICSPIFEEAAFRTTIYRFFKNDKIAFIVSIISFAWMHTGATSVLIIYLPISIGLTLIYHRRRVLAESILAHVLMNSILPLFVVFLQTITGLYYL